MLLFTSLNEPKQYECIKICKKRNMNLGVDPIIIYEVAVV